MKKAVFTLLQVGITIAILWLVFRDPTKRGKMLEALRNADSIWLFAGIGVYGIVEFLSGIRWQILLRVQSIHLGWGRLWMLVMIGIFFNFFIPGGTGGDFVKTYYLFKETHGKRGPALLSVLVDRLMGLFSLILFAGLMIVWRWKWLNSDFETAAYVWLGVAILGGSFIAITASFVLTGFGLVHKLPASMPGRDRVAELALAYNLYGRAWRQSLVALSLSMAANFAYFATFFCAGKAMATPMVAIPSFADLCAIMPIVNSILALPISFGGLGAREKLFEIFLGNLSGITPAVAVVISLTGFASMLFWGLAGGLCYALYRPSEHQKFQDMTAEVIALEHELAEKEIAMELADRKQRS